MTVEIRPYGDKCNLRCRYCYENPLRDHNLPAASPNWEVIREELKKQDTQFIVFGGDPLVTPIKELEEIWKFGKEKWNQNGIQTNGSLITETHIALFKQYNVNVGFSIDGPHTLNDARSAPSGELNATRALTEKSNENLIKCLKGGISSSLILTLHRLNTEGDRVYNLICWLSKLEMYGLKHARLHFLEEDGDVDNLIPGDEVLFAALTLLYEMKTDITFDIFKEFKERLKTGRGGTCYFQDCDPCNTQAVIGIGAQGEPTNCGRVNKEGIDFLKAGDHIPIRSYVLQATSQEVGGCKDCEFWYACKGNCPGTGIGGDWRNRTVHCAVLKRLMKHIMEVEDIKLLKPSEQPETKNRDHVDTHGNVYRDTPHGNSPHLDSDRVNIPHVDKTYLPRLEVRS